MGEINVNDWVRHRRTSHKGSVIDKEGNYYRVQWYVYASGTKLPDNLAIEHLYLKDEIEPLPPEPRIFSYDELVIAFMTEDEDWYYEVLALKGESVE